MDERLTPGTLRVLLFQDGDQWVAQGIERDIGAQGPDLTSVRRRFLQVADIDTFNEPAPPRIAALWAGTYARFRDRGVASVLWGATRG